MTMKSTCDLLSLSTVLVTLVGLLPNIAAGLSVIWYIIRLFEWWRHRSNDDHRL